MKKKILIVASGLPRPVKGGTALRFERLFKVLSEDFDLYFAVRLKDNIDKSNIKLNKDIFKEIIFIEEPRPNFFKKIKIVFNAFINKVPPQCYSMYFNKLSNEIVNFLNTNNIDAIHYDHLEYGFYYKDLKNYDCKHVLVVDDIVSDRYLEERNNSNNILEKIFNNITYKMYKVYEKRIIKEFNNIITVSNLNYNRIKKINNCNLSIVENGADIQSKYISKEINNTVNIMFLGNLEYKPNSDAAKFLLNEVVPLLNKDNISYKLFIIGDKASINIKKFESDNIKITGFVEDLDFYYNKCDIMVAPIFSGGGTRTKILESMAKGTVVISTNKGCEGINNIVDGKNILIANNAKEFVEKISFCINNKSITKDIELNAYNMVKNEYDWNVIGKKMSGFYKKLLN
ncbi:glycosyltransferase [Clostridium perfringens]|uniref:glycosyltransferase n=1 Tax=Clostridium perfringens TaxID=1502 RepID=UPI002A12B40F|nr:glycosyltransferase [Clostridium perfringens]MDM0888534.1 glycosyltransferase [Clostridium perfringens]MDM0900345.1 glycosyltransferase [Clostridium perfringens]MDM0909134.1 glycosyltransferase [Clostridium perfringens]MDM0914825.1 glycosyltransferase [Clostridium perfringens]